ncbi:hypothetical protein BDW72DRAFT_208395 [Aspergillus terricola var. indicus]
MAGIETSVWLRPEIGPRLRAILLRWSGLHDEELLPHLSAIRAQALPLGEYPCIGPWMFLLPGLAAFPRFPQILDQTRQTDGIILDLGCGLGQDLRLLAAHGVPTNQMWALDVEPRLWELGYDLLRDRGRMAAGFIHGDFLQLASTSLRRGKLNLVIAAQLLHLFDWDKQLAASKKIVNLSSPGTMLVGLVPSWDLVQQETQTHWIVDVKEVGLQEWGMQVEDLEWMPEDRMGINFVLTRDL